MEEKYHGAYFYEWLRDVKRDYYSLKWAGYVTAALYI